MVQTVTLSEVSLNKQTDRQNNSHNPRYACVPRVNLLHHLCGMYVSAGGLALQCSFIVVFRTRFYGFNLTKPSVHMLPKILDITDDKKILKITSTNSIVYKTNASDYLPSGDYVYICHDTYFLTFETCPASSLN